MLFMWLFNFKMIFNEIIVTQLWGLGGRADFVGSASAAHHYHDPPQPARLWSQHQRGLQPPWQTQKWGYHFNSVLRYLVLLITSWIMHKCQSESSSLPSVMCCILLFCSWQISNTKWVKDFTFSTVCCFVHGESQAQNDSSSLPSTMCCVLLFCSWWVSSAKWI